MPDPEASNDVHINLGRRQFLQASAGLTFMLVLGDSIAGESAAVGSPGLKKLSVWVHIDASGVITIYNPVAEMGQGSATTLPLILAEELDADWNDVSIQCSPIEPDIYGHDSIAGQMKMLTVGSFSVRAYFDRLRIAGAQVRQVLLENAAAKLAVPVGELTTQASVVHHRRSGRFLRYGEIAAFARIPTPLPLIAADQLKSPARYSLIGRDIPRYDIPAKVNGSAEYAIDVDLPNMRYGMIQRSPVNGASPVSWNSTELLQFPDITHVIKLDHGIGIVGNNLWAVMKARKELRVEWSKGAPAQSFDSDAVFADFAGRAASAGEATTVIHSAGNMAAAAASVKQVYEADYLNDFVYHAQLEPLNAVASVSPDGRKAELWIGSQFPSGLRADVAKLLNTPIDNITIHPRFLGGGFGRRSWHDFGTEAVLLAKASGVPVKLIWSREDDIQYGAFRPAIFQRLTAGVDPDGEILSWSHRAVGDDFHLVASGAAIPFYDIPNQQIDFCLQNTAIRTKHWRSVAHGPNKFAIESFIDEIASGQSVSPYLLRRKLLAKSPRALAVLDAAVDMSPWGSNPEKGRALGLAFAEGVGSLTAGVVEISLDEAQGKIRVHRVWAAIDAGLVIQPGNTIRQHEGAILQGISSALLESITIREGVVQQSNFDSYPMLTMADTPEIEIKLISSELPPAGVGEAALPFTGGAIGNAFAALTGKRLRHLPFSAPSVRAALGSA